jgi:hypothetical protein
MNCDAEPTLRQKNGDSTGRISKDHRSICWSQPPAGGVAHHSEMAGRSHEILCGRRRSAVCLEEPSVGPRGGPHGARIFPPSRRRSVSDKLLAMRPAGARKGTADRSRASSSGGAGSACEAPALCSGGEHEDHLDRVLARVRGGVSIPVGGSRALGPARRVRPRVRGVRGFARQA